MGTGIWKIKIKVHPFGNLPDLQQTFQTERFSCEWIRGLWEQVERAVFGPISTWIRKADDQAREVAQRLCKDQCSQNLMEMSGGCVAPCL